jgi:hypothetical protein
MNCINIKHPDFIRLLEETKRDPLDLQAEISLWMTKNGTESFPTVEELNANEAGRQQAQVNPIRQLGIKYNMNEHGFMPKTAPLDQLQRDAQKYNIKLKRASNGNYYFAGDNGRKLNPFYQLSPESQESPDTELRNRLFEWAETHGIEITAMEEMMERFGSDIEINSGAAAFADLIEKVIAISENKEQLDTLPEEIAHFATAILKDDASVKRAMDKISETEIFQKVKEEYKDVYSSEKQFKKEALDKMLAEAIIAEFKEEKVSKETKGFLQWLKAIISKFLRRFKKLPVDAKTEVMENLRPLAKSILAGDYMGNLEVQNIDKEDSIYYQFAQTVEQEDSQEDKERATPEERKKTFIERSIKIFEDNLAAQIARKGRKDKYGNKRKDIEILEAKIEQIRFKLNGAKIEAAIEQTITTATEQFAGIKIHLEKAQNKGSIDTGISDMLRNFANHYEDLFKNFQGSFNYFKFDQETIAKYNESFDEIRKTISFVHRVNDDLSKNIIIERGYSEEIFKEAKEEAIGWWRLNMGNFKYSSFSVMNKALEIIASSKYATRRNTNVAAVELLERQKALDKAGIKVTDFLEKTKDGKYRQALIQEYDWEDYHDQKLELEKKLAKQFKIDDKAGLDSRLLTEEQAKIYSTEIEKLRKRLLIYDSALKYKRPKKKNAKYAEIMSNVDAKAYYLAWTKLIKESVDKLPPNKRHRSLYYQVPGIRPQVVERLYNENGILSNIAGMMKEGLLKDEDDTQFGGEARAFSNRVVPIFFTQKMRSGTFSTDLTRSAIIFFEMAENFKQMNMIAPEMNTLLFHLGNRKYAGEKKGIQTNDYKAIHELIESHVYGVAKKDIKINALGKEISLSKGIGRLADFIRTINLSLNLVTSTAGFVKGNIDREIEDRIGLYTTYESKLWAMAEYGRQLPLVISEAYSKTQTSKIQLMLQMTNVVKLDHMIKNSNRNALMRRVASKDMLFMNYHLADFSLKGKAMLSIMDNFRLYKGNYIKKSDFITLKEREGIKSEKTINKEWTELRDQSFWNSYEAVDGKLVVKKEFQKYINDAVINRVTGTVEHLTHTLDGTLSELDRGQLSRQVLGDLLLMHRGWLINMIDTRTMGENINPFTGEKEIGSFIAMKDHLISGILEGYKNKNMMNALFGAGYKELDAHRKRGIKRTINDLIYLAILGFIVGAVNGLADADDDDEWWLQYAAYQLNRILLEQSAGTIFGGKELLAIVDEPVAGTATIQSLFDITEAFDSTAVKSGMYKDQAKWAKWWFRKTPFKHLYEMQYPKQKNRFIKQVVNSPTYDTFFKEADKNAETVDFFTQLVRVLPGTYNFEDNDEAIETIENLENEY